MAQVTWSGAQYAQYNEAQREWALDFIHGCLEAELGPAGTGEGYKDVQGDVLDLGCGDGSITSWLATRKLPLARVVGVDQSKEQLQYAREAYHSVDTLSFTLASATDLPDEWSNRFDMVLSFNALHWVKDQRRALQQIHKVLKRDGLLAFTSVLAGPHEFLSLLEILSHMQPWQEYLQDFVPECYPLNPRWEQELIVASLPERDSEKIGQHQSADFLLAYRHLLTSLGFVVDYFAVRPTQSNFDNVEEMKAWVTQWLPHRSRIPESLQDAFMDELLRTYLEHTGQSRSKGELHMWFDMLQVKARKVGA